MPFLASTLATLEAEVGIGTVRRHTRRPQLDPGLTIRFIIMPDADCHDAGATSNFAARPLAEITLGRTKIAISHQNGVFGVISTPVVPTRRPAERFV